MDLSKKNKNLMAARQKKGFTIEQMSIAIGYKSRSAYANIEDGRNTPSVVIAIKIAQILDEQVEYLFDTLLVHETRTKDGKTA